MQYTVQEQLDVMVGSFLNMHNDIYSIPMIFPLKITRTRYSPGLTATRKTASKRLNIST